MMNISRWPLSRGVLEWLSKAEIRVQMEQFVGKDSFEIWQSNYQAKVHLLKVPDVSSKAEIVR